MSFGVVRVLVIDDSAFNRRTIVKMLESLPNVSVVGYACDGEEGLRKVIDLKPDLVTLDLEMPRMDGFTLLRIVMQKQPTPIIVVSSRSDDEAVFKALELGAVEFVPKPSARVTPALMDIREEFLEKVREVTNANMSNILARTGSPPLTRTKKPIVSSYAQGSAEPLTDFRMVVVGSSTGGPPALQSIFSSIQEPLPVCFAVAQHMPPGFTKAFAERLDRFSALEIREAKNGDIMQPGLALIAPGGKNLELHRSGNTVIAKIEDPKPHQRYVPSVDVLFKTASRVFGDRLVASVLTGMGNDGASGVRAVKQLGGAVLAEAEDTCVVFGMPKEAIATDAVDEIVPLPLMCREILRYCKVGQ
jgi:two-component system chemotaxis response regulator CheB